MRDWYDREHDRLVDQFNNGEITDKEYHTAMRDLNDELRQQAHDAANEAYDNVMGQW